PNAYINTSAGHKHNPPHKEGGSPWHSSRITVETGRSDRGQHAHAPRKNKEKRRRRLRCAKPSARLPKPRRMRSKRPGSLEGYWFRETPPSLRRECRRICDCFRGAATTCIHAPSARTAASSSTANLRWRCHSTPLRERRLPDATAGAGLMPASGLTLRPR